jgi:glycine/D-amino acid oxidase-like deaminating enzyme
MTLSFWQRAARGAEVACDVAIVGGGVVGCSTAYWLRQIRPLARLAILDARHLAGGASGRNAGFVLQGTTPDYLTDVEAYGAERARRLWHFTKENRDLLLAELEPAAFAFEPAGSLRVAGSEAEDGRLRQAVPLMRAAGAPVAYLPAPEMNRRLGAHGFFGGLYVPSGAVLDPVALVRHVAAQSRALLLEHHRVVSVAASGSGVLLETDACTVRAEQAVLALNAYLPTLCPGLGRYVRPVRAQMLATAPVPPRWLPVAAYSHEGYFYLRQLADGTLLVGGARHLHRDEEVGYEEIVTPAVQADLERYLETYFSRLQGVGVRQRWSGIMGFSPDLLPVAGEVPDVPGSYWAAGFSGHGMAFGFRFGRLLAELVLGFSHAEDSDLFSADRFDGSPRRGEPSSVLGHPSSGPLADGG